MLPTLGGYKGPLMPLSSIEISIRNELHNAIVYLAGNLGERNLMHQENLNAAADYIANNFEQAGLNISEQSYQDDQAIVRNIIGEKLGKQNNKILVVGAHYDSVDGSPGADDNASGVAALIAIANLLKTKQVDTTIRFVAFCTEEPPYFYTRQMGSWQYAKMLKERGENIIGMFSLESIGYYSDIKNSQSYPMFLGALYPDKANFIGFVANLASRKLLLHALSAFRRNIKFPSEGISAPTLIPGIGWSDQWSFWKMGYKAVMITDTAPYRNPYYHTCDDLPDTIDYDRMARVVYGLTYMIQDLAR